jgi:polyisoprenoid-binding protein YceI
MNTSRLWLATLGLALVVAGCDNDPSKGKAKAQVSEPVAAQAAALPPGSALYVFSAEGSKVEFVGAKVTRKHDGSFGAFTGSLVSDGDAPEKSVVKVDIDVSTLTVDDPKLAKHLKGDAFFDVDKYPRAKFTSTSIRPADAPGTYTVTGTLDMHGVAKSIAFPAVIRFSGGAAEASAEFAINRKDWNISYPGKPDDLIKDDVLIKLSIHAKKPSA